MKNMEKCLSELEKENVSVISMGAGAIGKNIRKWVEGRN